jgi:hypothetical protein
LAIRLFPPSFPIFFIFFIFVSLLFKGQEKEELNNDKDDGKTKRRVHVWRE